MRKLVIAAIVLFFIAVLASAQEASISVTQRAGSGPTSSPMKKVPPKLTPEQQERAMQLLDGAAAGARGLDPGSRAYALIQIAKVYQTVDKKKAIELLEEAMTAAQGLAQEAPGLSRLGSRLQQQALIAMIPIAPEKADELVMQADPRSREQVLNSLLDYYERSNKMQRAMDVIYQIGQQGEIPYGAVATIMGKLKQQQQAEKQQLFTAALASFQNSDHSENVMRFGTGDFGDLIVRFYRELPPGLVHQAIDVVLDDAKKVAEKQAKSEDGPMQISLTSSKGAVQLNSYYMYRLFQLAPILKTLDPEEAEKLLKEQNDVQTMLSKYPQGLASVSGDSNSAGRDNTSYMVSSGRPSSGGQGREPQGENILERQREAQIARDAEEHPQDALANAASIQTPHLKVGAYLNIARVTLRKNSSIARQALQKATEAVDKMEPDAQSMSVTEIARMYLKLNDVESAKSVIEKGISGTEKLYKIDTDADDPNKAPKAYWASTVAWRSMTSLAAEISPTWAATLLKEIPDDEIRTLAQLGIATSLLQGMPAQTEVMSYTKDGMKMMIMNNEERPR